MFRLIQEHGVIKIALGVLGLSVSAVVGGLVLLFATSARAAEVQWNRWNVAPYSTSFEDACRKAPAAIDGFVGMSEAAKTHFKQVLGTTCKGGTEVWLTPHQVLEGMWSGGKHPHVMNNVTVGELPVLKSPDNRSYRKGAVAEAAKALSWTFTAGGKTEVFYIPLVCFNISWASSTAPEKKCVELTFNAKVAGYVRWGIGTTTGPLPPDECNAQRQGDGAWSAWYGECDICIPAIDYIRRVLGISAQIPHKYLYQVTQQRQTLRFSTAIWSTLVYICQAADGKETCGVYTQPEDWKGRYRVDIPDQMWVWDTTNCSQ